MLGLGAIGEFALGQAQPSALLAGVVAFSVAGQSVGLTAPRRMSIGSTGAQSNENVLFSPLGGIALGQGSDPQVPEITFTFTITGQTVVLNRSVLSSLQPGIGSFVVTGQSTSVSRGVFKARMTGRTVAG